MKHPTGVYRTHLGEVQLGQLQQIDANEFVPQQTRKSYVCGICPENLILCRFIFATQF